MRESMINLKNLIAHWFKREGAKEVLCIKRKDNDFEIQVLDNDLGGYSLYYLNNGYPAAVHITASGAVIGEHPGQDFPGRVVMPIQREHTCR